MYTYIITVTPYRFCRKVVGVYLLNAIREAMLYAFARCARLYCVKCYQIILTIIFNIITRYAQPVCSVHA